MGQALAGLARKTTVRRTDVNGRSADRPSRVPAIRRGHVSGRFRPARPFDSCSPPAGRHEFRWAWQKLQLERSAALALTREPLGEPQHGLQVGFVQAYADRDQVME